jgi:hypothetical protein
MKIKSLLLLVLLAFGLSFQLSAQTINATQTDEIIIDNGASGKADPNDRIRYKVTIQNTAGPTGTGTQLNVVPDPRTTFVPGTFRSSPLAVNDAYTSTGNVGITVPDGPSDLLANDYDDSPGGLTITAGTFATTGGGSITIAANGSFSYNPPRGFEGTDTYQYTLNDGNAVAGVTATDLGTVSFTVSGMIWFIDNTSTCSSNCDGRLSNPYTSLGAFNTANALSGGLDPDNNDNIFMYESATAYTGGIVLRNGQKLVGQDATVTLELALGLTLPTFSNGLPAMFLGAPFATITNAGGDGVTLGQSNTLRGFNIGACSDFGIENGGTNTVGVLTVSEMTLNNTTGGGFDASHGSSASTSVVLNALSSSGGTNGINLTNFVGTFTANGGTITNPTGTGVQIINGSVAVTYSGSISDNSGFAVDIDNHDSGNLTFSGNITSTGFGIRVQQCGGGTKTFSGSSKSLTVTTNTAVTLSSNTGATINFSNGGLVINTTSGTGFSATGGGTVTVQGTGNSITTTAAKALNLDGVLANVNFATISAGNVPSEGINLNNLSASSSLIVPGAVTIGMAVGSNANVNISGCSNCTIDLGTNGTTHNAVNLNSRRNSAVILNNASGTIRFGNVTTANPNSVTVPAIKSTTCAGSIFFAKTDVDMNLAGSNEGFTNIETPQDNSGNGDAIYINNFTGTAFTINGGTIENAGDDGIDIRNSQNLNLANVTTEDVGKSAGATCVDCNSSGVQGYNLTGTNTITNCSFQRGRLRNFYFSNSTGTATLNITGSTFNDTRSSGSPSTDNLQIYATSSASLAVDIENSTFTRSATKQIDVVVRNNAQLTKCDITGCTMDYVDGPSAGIFVEGLESSQVNFNIMNNPKLHSQDENVVTISAAGTANVQGRIKGNTNMKYNGSSPGGSIFSGIRVLSDGTTSVATVLIEGNTLEIVNCDFAVNLSVQGASAAVINATVNSNVITATGMTHFEGIIAIVNNTIGTAKLICLTINNNNVSGANLARVGRLRALSPTGIQVTNYVTDFNTTWVNNGNIGSPVAEGVLNGGTITAAPSPCALPTNPLP